MACDPGFQYKELYLFNFLDIQWIPRSENEKADYISRLIDHEDWEVSGNFFDLMNGL
jgi:hypothetical protein